MANRRWNIQGREHFFLWIAVVVAILLAGVVLFMQLAQEWKNLAVEGGRFPGVEVLTTVLFVWLLLLLWVAFRQWRQAMSRQTELERVISSIFPDVLLVVAPDRTIRMCNQAVEAMFGYTTDEIIGRKTDTLYRDRRAKGKPGEIREALNRIGFHIGYATGLYKTGEEFPLEIVTGDLKGRPGAVVLIRDITERRWIEEQLLRAKERADAANKAKSEVLAQLSKSYAQLKDLEEMRDKLTHMIVHDLKSPLAALHGYLQALRGGLGEGPAETGRKQCVDESLTLTTRIQDLIGTILDVHRLESNSMPLHREWCDLSLVCRRAVEILGQEARERSLMIQAPPTPPEAWCDAGLMTRVLVNLIGNAIKFTDINGTIMIRFEQQDGLLRVTVTDNGVGIPAEYLNRIFDKFFQVEVRKFSTGLGLTFCKMSIEAHGGRVGVISEQGQGTTFWFELPINPPDTGARGTPESDLAEATDLQPQPG